MLPTITITPEEQSAGKMTPERLAEASQLFGTNGTLIIRQILPPDLVNRMHTAFLERYQQYFVNKEHKDALTVGDKRFMVTLTFEEPFNTPLLYANPFAAPIMRTFLSAKYILGSFGSVVSLPGSQDQGVHRDFDGLFPDEGLDGILPPYAITLVVPLIAVNEITGTTLVWPRSHRMRSDKYPETDPELPLLSPGDCLLMDYRLVHYGSANRSEHVRPILYNIYWRPWFYDYMNYEKQPRLRLSRDAFEQLPEEHRHLFAQATLRNDDYQSQPG